MRRRWLYLAAAAVAVALRAAGYLALPLAQRVTYTPDDGFYYLGLGRHFAASHTWTWDGGVSVTTGFHLLHGYLCAALYAIAPGATAQAMLTVHALLAAAAAVATLAIWSRVLADRFLPGAQAALLYVGAASGFAGATAMAMEWPWAALCGALLPAAILAPRARLAFAIGILGTLARSDFPGATVAALAAAALARDRRLARASAWALAGALLATAAGFAHNLVVSGALLQSSVAMKAHWGALKGYSLGAVNETLLVSWLPTSVLLDVLTTGVLRGAHFAAAALVLVALLAPAWVRGRRARHPQRSFLLVYALLTLAGYVVVYGRNSAAIQPWYSADLVGPLIVLCAWLLEPLGGRRSALVVAALGVGLTAAGFALTRPTWPHQAAMKQAGEYLAAHPAPGRVGAWNAGIVGFFAGGRVVNLDGLVNDDIYRDAVRGELACYLLRADIRRVVDYPRMLDRAHAERGGYGDGALAASLTPTVTFAAPRVAPDLVPSIWMVDRNRLRRACPR